MIISYILEIRTSQAPSLLNPTSSGLGLMLNLFWKRYQAHPIISAIENFYTPSFLKSFPALTLCPMIALHPEIRSRLLKRIRLPDGISEERASSHFRRVFEMSHPKAVMYEERDQMKKILRLNDYQLTEILVALRSPCEAMAESC